MRQHLTDIFDQPDVSSRGEFVAKIYVDCYDLRARDNRGRIQDQGSIRGGGPRATTDAPEAPDAVSQTTQVRATTGDITVGGRSLGWVHHQ